MTKRLINCEELIEYTGLGRNKAVSFAKENHAEVRIGRRCLFDLTILDRVIDALHEEGSADE